MESVVLRKISFGSFIKIFFLLGIASGILLGLFLFILSLFGAPVTANIGETEWYGITAGVISLFLAPLICAALYFFASLPTYPIFLLVLKLLKGIKVNALLLPSTQGNTETQASGTAAVI